MLPFRRDDPFIRDQEKPSCIECIHYKPDYLAVSVFNQCTKFGGKDLHTGDILYDYADSVRRDESKCGKAGRYFKRDPVPFKLRRLVPVIAILGLLFSIRV
jgi:hypothetical protein